MTEDSQASLAVIAIRQVEKSTGASRNAFEQATALKALGYRVVVLAERGRHELAQAVGADLVRLKRWPLKGAFRRFWFNRRVQAWCRRHQPAMLVSHGDVETPDVVYMHNCVHLASQRIQGRELPEGHEVAAIHDRVLQGGKFRRLAVNSRMMAEDFHKRYGIPFEKIEVSYPGYDPQVFNPQRAMLGRRDVRREFEISEDEFLIGLVVSGNFKKRNVVRFVETAAEIESRLPGKCRFLVVGKDDFSAYHKKAEDLGVESRFLWRGTVPEVEKIYGALDVFVLPAFIEEFGRAALEAMACGIPVVLSSWVGAAELLEKEHRKHVVSCDGDWVAKVVEVIEDPHRHMVGDSLARLASKYSHASQHEKMKQSFERLAD